MKIGVFGGTFDPPHIGHQILAAEALQQFNLDQVLWVLTNLPPHKKQQKITSLEHRIRMVELAIKDNPDFILSRVDIDREPPYFAAETLSLLKKKSPGDEFFYLMGLDLLNDLPKWHDPVDFVELCDGIIVMSRHGETLDISHIENQVDGVSKKLYILNSPIIDISSTDIRARVKKGLQYRYFVPKKMFKYISYYQLYLN